MNNKVVLSALIVGGAAGLASLLATRGGPDVSVGVASTNSSGPSTPASRTAPHRGRTATVGGDPVDLSGIMNRTRHAFHSVDGAQLVGGDVSFGVRIANGEIAIHPEAGSTSTVGSALRLHTVAVGRLGAVHTAQPYSLRDDGTVEASLAPAITEQLHNTASGLEQSWTFDDVADGSGDLVVRVAADGEDFVGATSTGLHFRDSVKGIGLSMSHARWIDADGTATEIPLRYEHGEIAMIVPANVVENAAYPAVLDPTVGPEYDVDTPIVGPSAEDQSPVSIGHSGVGPYEFLVAWQDRRRSTDTDLTYDVFGAHVDRTGHVREPVGFIMSDPTVEPTGHTDGNQTDPQVAWLPYQNRYIVVWTSDSAQPHLAYRFVDVTTNALGYTRGLTDPLATVQCHQGWTPTQPSVAVHSNSPNPDHVFIAWREAPSGSNAGMVCAHDFVDDSPDDSIRDYSGRIFVWDQTSLAHDAGAPAVATVAWTLPNRFITAFQEFDASSGFYQIRYMRYQADQPQSFGLASQTPQNTSPPITVKASAVNPSVGTWGGVGAPYDGWLIAYEQNDGTILHPDYNVYGTLVAADGTAGNGSNAYIGFHINHSTGNQRVPSVAGFGLNDSQMLVAWADSRSLSTSARGARISLSRTQAPTVLDGPADGGTGISMAGNAGNGVVVHSDEFSAYFAVWPDGRNGSYGDVYGANIPFSLAANGTVTNYIISKSANKETAPAVAQCGGKYLVAWTDSRNVGLSGKDIYGSLLNADGSVAVQSIALSTAPGDQQHPAIGCLAPTSQFFVVWEDSRNGDPDIYGIPVDVNGSPSLEVPIANTAGQPELHPAVAGGQISSGTTGFAIAYDINNDITNVVMVDKTGAIKGGPFQIAGYDDTHINATHPDIDFDQSNYVVVWEEIPPNQSQDDIWAARLSPSGAVNAPFEVEGSASDQRYPRIRFDAASTYATVVFEDDRNLSTQGVDIYARRITSGGVVLALSAVAASADDEYAPQLAVLAGSGSAQGSAEQVTYSRIPRSDGFNFDVMGQSLQAGSANGSAFAISNASTSREMTPSIACSTLTCVVAYRWFSTTDTATDIDRVKARVLNY